MNENRSSGWIFGLMKHWNFLIIVYISVITAHSLLGHVNENTALEFLTGIRSVPLEPWKIPLSAIGLYICLLLLLSIQCESMQGFILKICVESAVGCTISCILSLGYTGVILLVIADIMQYASDMKRKVALSVMVCGLYLIMDYNILSVHLKLISLNEYWTYYRGDICSAMLGFNNLFSSLNTILFIVYMIVLFVTQVSEKKRVQSLNEELYKVNEELKEANLRLEEYAKESGKNAETRERNRLAREIHDTLGHSLTGIVTGIEACLMLMERSPETAKEQLAAIADVARQGMKDVRRSVKALRPDALETLNLEQAILRMVDELKRSTKVEIDYRCETKLRDFSKDEEDVIYRIIQEGLTNSVRHGKAKKIWIQITREYNMLKIRIKDNGIGCSSIQKGFGLHHMEERLDMLHGTISYSGEDGFTLEVQIPIRWGTEENQ